MALESLMKAIQMGHPFEHILEQSEVEEEWDEDAKSKVGVLHL